MGMELIHTLTLGVGLLGVLAILASTVAPRLGVPILLVFLVVGMLAGENGPGGIAFSDYWLAHLLGSTALYAILFDGGLKTELDDFRVGLKPAALLATLGVGVTAGVTGAAAHYLLKLDWGSAFLLGAVVSSTDAAAVFGLLQTQRIGLNRRLKAVLEIESGGNDPMAVMLTVGLVTWLAHPSRMGTGEALLFFVEQLGGGALAGWLGGWALAWALTRVRLADSLYPLLALLGGLLIFGAAQFFAASGYLAAYLAGLQVARYKPGALRDVRRFLDGVAWMAQIGLFLILGLLVTPKELLGLALPALALAGVLVLVARPLAVMLSLSPFRLPIKEQVFVSWVGLRGAVPIVLATYPLLERLPSAKLIFNIAFFLVLVSLLLQGSTVRWAAQKLGLMLPEGESRVRRSEFDLPGQSDWEMLSYRVLEGTRPVGLRTKQLALPDASRVVCVVRKGQLLPYSDWGRLQVDDHITLLAKHTELEQFDHLFEAVSAEQVRQRDRFFGALHLTPDALVEDLCAVYGVALTARSPNETVAQAMLRMLPDAVPGDRLRLGALELTVREMDGKHITDVGLKFVEDPS